MVDECQRIANPKYDSPTIQHKSKSFSMVYAVNPHKNPVPPSALALGVYHRHASDAEPGSSFGFVSTAAIARIITTILTLKPAVHMEETTLHANSNEASTIGAHRSTIYEALRYAFMLKVLFSDRTSIFLSFISYFLCL